MKIMRGAEVLGDYEPEKIREYLARGSLVATDLFWNDAASEWLPLSELSGNAQSTRKKLLPTFSALGAWFKKSDAKQNETLVIGIALALLIASWLYPPGFYRDHSHGWFFLFDTRNVARVDFERLILLDAIIVGIAGAMIWAGSRWRLNLVAVALFMMAGVVFFVAVAISWQLIAAQIERSKRDAESRAENARIEEQRRVSTAEAEIQQARAVQARAASEVLPDDLKRIAVFQCYYNSDIRAVEGRIMNRLPRRIHDVALKLSVNGYQETVVDVEHAIIADTLTPEETKSFSWRIEIPGLYTQPGSGYIPGVWLYKVQAEVTDAYYED